MPADCPSNASEGPSCDLRSGPQHGPRAHHIQLKASRSSQQPVSLLKRFTRALVEGRLQARKLSQAPAQRPDSENFSRRRSFSGRSARSEDMLCTRLSMETALRSREGADGRRGAKWLPSMSRIQSGQNLVDAADASFSSASSEATGKRLAILMYNGLDAAACLGSEATDPVFACVREVVQDVHLLQFGALIGEASAELALTQAGGPGAVSREPGSLLGSYDRLEAYRQGWEAVVEVRAARAGRRIGGGRCRERHSRLAAADAGEL
jgi:hypothetical protein